MYYDSAWDIRSKYDTLNKVKYANSQNVNDIIAKLDSIINSISDVKIQNELKDVQNQIRELVK